MIWSNWSSNGQQWQLEFMMGNFWFHVSWDNILDMWCFCICLWCESQDVFGRVSWWGQGILRLGTGFSISSFWFLCQDLGAIPRISCYSRCRIISRYVLKLGDLHVWPWNWRRSWCIYCWFLTNQTKIMMFIWEERWKISIFYQNMQWGIIPNNFFSTFSNPTNIILQY